MNGRVVTDIIIPDAITSIGKCTFYDCSCLTSVTIPNSVTSIEDRAFSYCSGLTSVIIPNSVTSIGYSAFSGCNGLTSMTIPSSVTGIGLSAFSGCKLRNVLIKCNTPPMGGDAFSNQTYYHTTLYVPTGCWDAYAYDNNWYKFINIRETAMEEEQLSMQQAYTMMDAGTFAYSVYDPVNDCIGTISSVGIDENNPNHSWQVIEADGSHYLYNVGAKKFVVASANGYALSESPTPIEMSNGDNGIIIGSQSDKQWALVTNERMNAEQAIIDGIDDIPTSLQSGASYYDLQGRRIGNRNRGVNIIRYSDGTSRKVLLK